MRDFQRQREGGQRAHMRKSRVVVARTPSCLLDRVAGAYPAGDLTSADQVIPNWLVYVPSLGQLGL